jgi:hypothetical protein
MKRHRRGGIERIRIILQQTEITNRFGFSLRHAGELAARLAQKSKAAAAVAIDSCTVNSLVGGQ